MGAEGGRGRRGRGGGKGEGGIGSNGKLRGVSSSKTGTIAPKIYPQGPYRNLTVSHTDAIVKKYRTNLGIYNKHNTTNLEHLNLF